MERRRKSEEKQNSKSKEEIKEERNYRHSKKYYNYKRKNKNREKLLNKKNRTTQSSRSKNNNRRTYTKRTDLIQERIKILQLAKKNIDEEEEENINNKKETEKFDNNLILTENGNDFNEIKNNININNNLLLKSLQTEKKNINNTFKLNLVENNRYVKKFPSKILEKSPKIIKKYQTSTYIYKKDPQSCCIKYNNNNKYNRNTVNIEKEINNKQNKNRDIDKIGYKTGFVYQSKAKKRKIDPQESPKNERKKMNSYVFVKAKSKKNIHKNDNILIKSKNNINEIKEYDSESKDIMSNREKDINNIYIPKKIQHHPTRGTSQENINKLSKHNFTSSNVALKNRYKSLKKMGTFSNTQNNSNNNINININNNIKIIAYNKKMPHWNSNKKTNDIEIFEKKIDEDKFDIFKDNISDISSIESKSYIESETTENNNKLNVFLNNIYKTKSIFHPQIYRKKQNNKINEKESTDMKYSLNTHKDTINEIKTSRNISVPHFIFKKRTTKDMISDFNNKSKKNMNKIKGDVGDAQNIQTIKRINNNSKDRGPKFYEFVIIEEKLKNIIDEIEKNSDIISKTCFDFLNNFNESSFLTTIEKIFDNNNLKIIQNYLKYLIFLIILLYDYCMELVIDENNKFLIQEVFSLNIENIFHLYEYTISKIKSKDPWSIIIKNIIDNFKKQKKNVYSSSTNINYHSIFDKIKNNTKYIRQIINRIFSFSKKINKKIMPFFKELETKSFEEIKQFFIKNIFQKNNSYGYIYPHNLYTNNKKPIQEYPNFIKKDNNKKYTLFIGLEGILLNYKQEEEGETNMNKNIKLRPNAIMFLREIQQYYEIIVFSLCDKIKVDSLTNSLDKRKKFIDYKLNRDNFKILNDEFVLDLNKISRDLNKVVIVGNIPQIFQLFKENAINIKSYWDENLNDNILIKLIPILKNIVEEKGNVPELLLKYQDEIIKNITIGTFKY